MQSASDCVPRTLRVLVCERDAMRLVNANCWRWWPPTSGADSLVVARAVA